MFKIKGITLFLVVIMVSLIFVGGVWAADSLVIQGSSTVFPISQTTAEAYMNLYPHVNLSVRGGGSGNGIAALIDNAVELAQSSRFIKQTEVENAVNNGVYPVPHRVAMDGIVPVVHPSNPISDLSLDQLREIYTGRITNWKDLGGNDQRIVVVSRDSSSGTFGVYNEIVLRGERLTPNALLQASNGAIVGVVSETRGAIGYVGMGYLSDALKAVAIDGALPTNQSVASGEFPIARPLFLFTNGWPEGLAAHYISFVLSAEGQNIIEEQGFVPIF